MLNNLIKISDLLPDEVTKLVNMAKDFKYGNIESDVRGRTVVLMFFENSTRTRISFELAAKKLGMNVILFDTKTSSINKGESLRDTVENLYYIGTDAVVIRHSQNNLIENLVQFVNYPIKFINAGQGNSSHPTQSLLDYMTMIEKVGTVRDKKVVILGDIEHSRVAKSNIAMLKKFGAKITICAPEFFKPQTTINLTYEPNLRIAIEGADIIMAHRIQKERIQEAYSEEFYINNYQLNSELIDKKAPNAILMHPGPVNREIEMTSELLDSFRGHTILEQAKNGMFIRMAVLNTLLGGEK